MTRPADGAWLNACLIGRAGSRAALNTPALVLDLPAFERNLQAMARYCEQRGLALRPHAKTHKCGEIARRQMAAGAVGLCCAKLAEAEVFAALGVTGLLLTSPVVTDMGLARLIALLARAPDLMVVCDDADNARRLGRGAAAAGLRLRVLVDIDVGLGRTGVATLRDGVQLARLIAETPGLELYGVQGYAGHVMHIRGRGARRAATSAALELLRGFKRELERCGLAPRIVTGGGTGTFDLDPDLGVLTELQAGSYVFMDREYNDVWGGSEGPPPFETSLFVQSTVVSAARPGRATTDAGCKAFATEAGVPSVASGAPPGTTYAFFGDEQGLLSLPPGAGRLAPGAVVSCVTPHCDPTVNLYDVIHVVRDGALVDIWPVEARGRAQ
ncbi:DSD1 family PLP-dependent enzyme [Phenylobacterium sp.]|uniref:DSD1 family PLP-dependent enzyme n=1 Tax=Phenylobacterium sp. TaxID=1871053 RepID=UPI0035B4F4B1